MTPSPEARVDWLKEATILMGEAMHTKFQNDHDSILCAGWMNPNVIAKALSAAFEKGREAR